MKGIGFYSSLFLKKLSTKWPVVVFDVLAIPLAWYLSYWLRYNMEWLPIRLLTPVTLMAFSMLMLVQVASYYGFKVYRGLWRYSSLSDVDRILKAVVFASSCMVPLFYSLSFFPYVPRSILPIYGLILVTLLCGARLLLRQVWGWQNKTTMIGDAQRVLIIGAGQAGESLIRDLKRTSSYCPVGLVDDNPSMMGLEVHGVRVLGTLLELSELIMSERIDLIFIAIPSAGSATMRRIVNSCERCNIPVRTLPTLQALASGRVEVNALRKVNLDDLLGRDQVKLEWERIAIQIQGKRVVVTGGGGSIGSELCRQVMRLQPEKLLVLDNSEFNLYAIEQELNKQYPGHLIDIALVSVADSVAVNRLFSVFKPEIVFHAAAYKHVPLLENQVRVAVQNNILGTHVVAQASALVGVQKFVLISTDKAVNPTNVMGATKRAAEIYCQNFNALVKTQFITVRFGNVLGSTGSVVPLFQKQLEYGGPLTVTHPDMQRYFMTIAEACQLILQATANGEGGEIFVLDMGEPVKISYLAEQMIRLAGKELDKDITIQYTGLRPGEKLFEELFHPSEQLTPTSHEKLLKAKFRQHDWTELTTAFQAFEYACNDYRHDELYALLKRLVPEFKSDKNPVVRLNTEEIL